MARMPTAAAACATPSTPGPPASTTPVNPDRSMATSPARTTGAMTSAGTCIADHWATIGRTPAASPAPENGPGPVARA